ncbi:hypothetical protein Ciccas_014496 [Cichlidogyrus casuarinus]|uniref:Tetraspanin n=1 Tax=Cichlidogyrus casuarinus TaxID=1844966 RepID=A0ABD2PI80_9PLAT
MVSTAYKCYKVWVFILTLLTFIGGLIILMIGVKFYPDMVKFASVWQNFKMFAMYPLIVGPFLMALALLICCSACKEASTWLKNFATLLCISFIGFFVLWLSLMLLEKMLSRDKIAEDLRMISVNGMPPDSILLGFQCCGLEGPLSHYTAILPPACCGYTDGTACLLKDAYLKGCSDAVYYSIPTFFLWMTIIHLALGVVVAPTIFITCYLAETVAFR